VTWDAQGNIYLSDGYVNSRVAKYDKNGDWVKSWGQRGKGPGEFTSCTASRPTPGQHLLGDATPAYPGVRTATATFKREIKIDVPFDENAKPAIGNKPTSPLPANRRAASARGALALASRPGRTQVLYSSIPIRRIYKLSLGRQRCSAISASRANSSSSWDGCHEMACRPRTNSTSRDSNLAGAEAYPATGPAKGASSRAAMTGPDVLRVLKPWTGT